MKTSQRSNSAHRATAESLGNDRKRCRNALCCKVSFWMLKQNTHTHGEKYSLPVCQLPALHPGLVSHHLFLENQRLSHNPPYDCANVLPYDVKNSWSRHHWAGLEGACGRWSLDYYWLKKQLWVLFSDVWVTTSGRSLQTGDHSYRQRRIIFLYELCDSVIRELYEWHKLYKQIFISGISTCRCISLLANRSHKCQHKCTHIF